MGRGEEKEKGEGGKERSRGEADVGGDREKETSKCCSGDASGILRMKSSVGWNSFSVPRTQLSWVCPRSHPKSSSIILPRIESK